MEFDWREETQRGARAAAGGDLRGDVEERALELTNENLPVRDCLSGRVRRSTRPHKRPAVEQD